MEIIELKKQIKARALGKVYVLYGDEIKAQDIYIHKIAEVTDRDIQQIGKVSESFNKRGGLFSKATLFVCSDDIDFAKSNKTLDDITPLLGDNGLILRYNKLGGRGTLPKGLKDVCVEFKHMSDDVIGKYVRKELDINDTWLDMLIHTCENDYCRLLNEIDKIKCYALASGESETGATKTLLFDGTIYTPPKDAIFDFVDAVLGGKTTKAFELLAHCEELGEPNMRLITVLYNNFKNLLLVQSCKDKDIAKATGLNWGAIKGAEKHVNKAWSTSEIVKNLKLLQSIESRIKRGEIEEQIAVDYFLAQVL